MTQAIRRMHADLVERNMLPNEIDGWRTVIQQAAAAAIAHKFVGSGEGGGHGFFVANLNVA